MPDDIREYIRGAQAAEIRGDKPKAVQLLKKAAQLYEDAGNQERALQMIRHVKRLEGEGLDGAIEPTGESRTSGNASADSPSAAPDRKRALRSQLADRGPALADPDAEAWCSFCCRPRPEVGKLVAGPTGAFVCAGCLRRSMALLGGSEEPPLLRFEEPAPSQSPLIAALKGATLATPVPTARESARDDFIDLHGVIPQLAEAMREGAKLTLLLGPPGSGKTSCLRALEAQGFGVRVDGLELPERPEGALLVDEVDGLDEKSLRRLAAALRSVTSCVLAARGEKPAANLPIRSREASHSLYTTQALTAACGARLPVELLEQVRGTLTLPSSSAQQLAEIARKLAAARALVLSDELIAAIAAQAVRSKRGGHEVKALIDRIPDGSWSLAAAAKRSNGKPRRPPTRPR